MPYIDAYCLCPIGGAGPGASDHVTGTMLPPGGAARGRALQLPGTWSPARPMAWASSHEQMQIRNMLKAISNKQ